MGSAMSKASSTDLIAALHVAIAVLAEELNDLGVQRPRSSAKRVAQASRLHALARDCAALAKAADVLLRRPGLTQLT